MHLLDTCKKVGTHSVHLVHIGDLRNTIFVRLAPDSLRLRLYTAYSTEGCNRTVEYAERTLDFNSEVNVARSIDKVDLVHFVIIVPERCGSGRSDGNASLLLLDHPVHCCGTFVYLTDSVSLSCIEKNTLRCGSLTGIDVSHDTDIPCEFKISFASSHSTKSIRNGSVQKPCLPLPSCAYPLFSCMHHLRCCMPR